MYKFMQTSCGGKGYIKELRYKLLQLLNRLKLNNLSVIQYLDNSLLFMICLYTLRDERFYVLFYSSATTLYSRCKIRDVVFLILSSRLLFVSYMVQCHMRYTKNYDLYSLRQVQTLLVICVQNIIFFNRFVFICFINK